MNGDSSSFEEQPFQNYSISRRGSTFKGPLRVARLCILGILIPCALLGIPLYMRYRVYGHQLYPLAMSDMRLLDSSVSTTWCQRQKVKVNTTFNAFLLANSPHISLERKTMSMVRELVLEDDTKEYWGFYLLKDTSVKVSTCVRWPGASLVIIRGHKHLHECAFIGDDSSEELDELMEAIREGTYVADDHNLSDDEAPANEPDMMKRHRPDVKFHSPIHKNSSKNHTLSYIIDASEVTDPKTMKQLLETLREKSQTKKGKLLSQVHTHRNSTIAKDETENFKIVPPKRQTSSQELIDDILEKLKKTGNRGSKILEKINEKYNQKNIDLQEPVISTKGRHYSKPSVNYGEFIDQARRRRRDLILSAAKDMNKDDEENDKGIEEGFTADGIANHHAKINETTLNDMSNSEFWSSFSSSEEALLNCAGLILNLPLTPHHRCYENSNEEESYRDNTITYKVPTNGYYFFVFNSENEVQPNYIRVQFNLDKAVYNVSNPISSCANVSGVCSMDLDFFSSEKLVMELPVNDNNTMWNEEFIVVSECEPRTAIYVVCAILVPVLVILFAFS